MRIDMGRLRGKEMSIATALLEHGVTDDFDEAMIISGDSDLVRPSGRLDACVQRSASLLRSRRRG
jgi:hypothetical protein